MGLNGFHTVQLAGKEAQVHAVGSNVLETTTILFELPYDQDEDKNGTDQKTTNKKKVRRRRRRKHKK